jgi:hypothetical protein
MAQVYNGTADYLLHYMRQQRCGYNPFLKDSCHVHDGYIVYHPTKTGQHIDVRGGWHDATDYLQYTTTSANAIYQMMFAYQENPESFGDAYDAAGHPGANGIPDIVDEIKWGLDWLNRMNPAPGELYNQIADIPFSITERQRTEPFLYIPKTLTLNKETHQAHVMIGSRGYNAYNEKRTGLYLLNNLLGGPGMNSRLNVSLRERRGLVYNVEANLTSYTDTGVFCIYFGTDPEDADRCIGLVHKELKKLRDSKLSSSQLSAAKKQIIGQIGVAGDNFENNALDMGKTFLHYGKFEGPEEVFKRIEMLTAEHLWDIANEMFDENYLSTLIYL